MEWRFADLPSLTDWASKKFFNFCLEFFSRSRNWFWNSRPAAADRITVNYSPPCSCNARCSREFKLLIFLSLSALEIAFWTCWLIHSYSACGDGMKYFLTTNLFFFIRWAKEQQLVLSSQVPLPSFHPPSVSISDVEWLQVFIKIDSSVSLYIT